MKLKIRPTARPQPNRLRAALVAALCAATLVAVVAYDRQSTHAAVSTTTSIPSTTSPPTVTSAPATTTTVPPGTTATVATAIVPQVKVSASPPAGCDNAPLTGYDTRGGPIPSTERAVTGRFATPTGWLLDTPDAWGGTLTLGVVDQCRGWVRVVVPARPNGTTGWVPATQVAVSYVDTRVEVDVASRHLRAWVGDELIADTPVVVGADATPTPAGRHYLAGVRLDPGGAYGVAELPLTAYSPTLDQFDGGAPVTAIHGTPRPDLVGQALSNGCVRVPNEVVAVLAARLPAGTPVDIR